MELGLKLRQLRENTKLTQKALSEILNKSARMISFYENGINTPDYETLKKYANYFKISTDDLLGNPCDLNLGILRSRIEEYAYDIIYNKVYPLNERIQASMAVFFSKFMRSKYDGDYESKHPSFEEYISMRLNNKNVAEIFGEDVYEELCKEYGMMIGLPMGSSYYHDVYIKHEDDPYVAFVLENRYKMTKLPDVALASRGINYDEFNNSISEDQVKILDYYRKLDKDGKTMIMAKLIEELRLQNQSDR